MFGKKWKRISNDLKGINIFYGLGRTPKQVRERYVNFLRPNLNNERWSIEEDLRLVDLINKYGRKWNKIVEEMGTRSHNQIRNRYNHRIMKVWKQKCE